MEQHKLPLVLVNKLGLRAGEYFDNETAWLECLHSMNIRGERHIRIATGHTPALFAASRACEHRFWEFFAATVRNKNTRLAYQAVAYRFADWCEFHHIDLQDVELLNLSAYIEQMTHVYVAPTVKQHLAGIRMLFAWLVIGQIVVTNPASSVRGPKHYGKVGKTPILNATETRSLFD